jgi:protein SCO1/2
VIRHLLALIALAALASCGARGPAFTGSDVSGSSFGREFSLTDAAGRTRTLADYKGKAVALFFGYTQCPDVCPTTLAALAGAMKILGPDADRVQVLFVTVDPERDSPAVLKDYLSNFDPHLRGLTGDPAAVNAALKAFRVYAKKVPLEGSDYTMDHTAVVYLMDKNGHFVAPFNMKRTAEAEAADLRGYL